ncbi:hypothetical protein MTP99_001056 [Tenebrio molitor]|jgi:hypothetical protein|nr:hypothetical protein MTP99_001056 [Tenebrio molitor]
MGCIVDKWVGVVPNLDTDIDFAGGCGGGDGGGDAFILSRFILDPLGNCLMLFVTYSQFGKFTFVADSSPCFGLRLDNMITD